MSVKKRISNMVGEIQREIDISSIVASAVSEFLSETEIIFSERVAGYQAHGEKKIEKPGFCLITRDAELISHYPISMVVKEAIAYAEPYDDADSRLERMASFFDSMAADIRKAKKKAK
jgi:hypothetical protein